MLTLGYMATTSKGQTFVVSAMLSNASVPWRLRATVALLDVVIGAFGLITRTIVRPLVSGVPTGPHVGDTSSPCRTGATSSLASVNVDVDHRR